MNLREFQEFLISSTKPSPSAKLLTLASLECRSAGFCLWRYKCNIYTFGNPHQISLVACYGFENAEVVEKSIHQKLGNLRFRGD